MSETPAVERRSITRNALTSYGERGVLLLTTLLLTPYLFRELGVGGFGTWSVMFALITAFNILEVGISAGITKFVAQFGGPELRTQRLAVLRAGVLGMAAVGVTACAISVLIGQTVAGLADPGERGAFEAGMIVLGLALLVRFPCAACGAALAGHQRYDLFNLSLIVTSVAFAVVTVVLVEGGLGVLGVAIAWAAALVAGGIVFVVGLLRVEPGLTLRGPRGGRSEDGGLLRFSSMALLAESMVFMGQRLDPVLVAAIRDAAAAAPLAAGTRLRGGLQALTQPISKLLMPMASDLWARGQEDEVFRRFSLATRLTVQLTLPIAAWVVLFCGDIVDVWLGPTAPDETAAIFAIFAVQALFMAAAPAEKVLVGIGRIRVIALLTSAESLLSLAASVALTFAYGALGAAAGSLLASTLLGPVKIPVACRAVGRATRAFLVPAIGRPLLSCLPALAAMIALLLFAEPGNVRVAVALTAAVVLTALVAVVEAGPRRVALAARALRRASNRAPVPTART